MFLANTVHFFQKILWAHVDIMSKSGIRGFKEILESWSGQHRPDLSAKGRSVPAKVMSVSAKVSSAKVRSVLAKVRSVPAKVRSVPEKVRSGQNPEIRPSGKLPLGQVSSGQGQVSSVPRSVGAESQVRSTRLPPCNHGSRACV